MNLVMGISDHVQRAELRQEDRRGPAGRGAREPGRDRGLPRHRRRAALATPTATPSRGGPVALLELRDVEARYGQVRALRRRLARGRGGRRSWPCSARTAPARRRRCARSRARSSGAARSSFDGKRARPARAGGGREARRRARPGGPRHLLRAVGRGEPPARRLHAPRLARRRHRADERLLPLDRRAARASTRARSPAASSRCSRSPGR